MLGFQSELDPDLTWISVHTESPLPTTRWLGTISMRSAHRKGIHSTLLLEACGGVAMGVEGYQQCSLNIFPYTYVCTDHLATNSGCCEGRRVRSGEGAAGS